MRARMSPVLAMPWPFSPPMPTAKSTLAMFHSFLATELLMDRTWQRAANESLSKGERARKVLIFNFKLLLLAFGRRRVHPKSDMASIQIPRTGAAETNHAEANTTGDQRRGRMARRLASAGRATGLGGRPGYARFSLDVA